MANYLWVGKGFAYPSSEVTSPAMRVDKYSWNGPGNWMVAQVYQGVTRWMPTQAIPGGGDNVTLGYSSAAGGSAAEYPGWIPAKCPLLFGGYSGGVGAGLYPGSTAAGTTFTSSLNDIRANVTDWNFDVGVGAGLGQVTGGDYSILSGNLKWAMEQDNLGALPGTPPITDSNYYNLNTAQTGLVGPAYRLTLKYKNFFSYTDKTWSLYNPIDPGSCGDTTLIGATAHRGRGLEFNCVKAYTQVSSLGSTAAAVKTKFSFDCGRGQGLLIQNGSFDSIDINTAVQETINDHIKFIGGNIGKSLTRVGEISLRNLFAKTLSYAKCETVAVSGGTYAQINIHQHPYMANSGQYTNISGLQNYYTYPDRTAISYGNSANPTDLLGFKFWDQRTTYVGCGFSGAAVYKDLYAGFAGASGGVPSVPTEFVGVLNLTNRPIEMLFPVYVPIAQYLSYPLLLSQGYGNAPSEGFTQPDVFNDTYTCLEIGRSHHNRIKWYGRPADTQQVELYIYGGLTSAAYVPVINVDGYVGPSTIAPDVHQFKWQTWELRLGGNLNIGTINNRSGLVTAFGQENESQLITVKNLRLSKYGSLDLHRADFAEYARMKFGGITGGTGGTTVTDGIIFEDNTGYIIGMGSRLIPNYTFGGRNVTKGIKDTSSSPPVAFD